MIHNGADKTMTILINMNGKAIFINKLNIVALGLRNFI